MIFQQEYSGIYIPEYFKSTFEVLFGYNYRQIGKNYKKKRKYQLPSQIIDNNEQFSIKRDNKFTIVLSDKLLKLLK